jgi:hypothetical protein
MSLASRLNSSHPGVQISSLNSGSISTSSGQLAFYSGPPTVEYLVLAGGGSGSWSGGGGGGCLTGTYTVVAPIKVLVQVGAVNVNSYFGAIEATKGGQGQAFINGDNGGSGGGGGSQDVIGQKTLGGTGIVGQGFAGGDSSIANSSVRSYPGAGGGSGQAGATGTNPGAKGGDGKLSSITGTAVNYGGGGGAWMGWLGGTDGAHGAGGNLANSGGGGTNGSGSSGVVIIRYSDTYPIREFTQGSPTYTNAGGYHIYKFTGSGSVTF